METSPAERPTQDRLGQAIRTGFGDLGLRLGAAAAGVIVLVSWLGTFALSLLPGSFPAYALGVAPGPHAEMTVGAKLGAAFFAPWLIRREENLTGVTFSERAVSLPATAILILVLVGTGFAIRSLLPTLRGRITALLACVLLSAFVVALGSALVRYVVGTRDGEAVKITHASQTFIWIPLLLVITIGVFAYGVVALLHPPLRTALRGSALVITAGFLSVALAFSIAIVSWAPTNYSQTHATDDLAAVLDHWGASAGGVATPLSFGARAHLDTRFESPFRSTFAVSDPGVRLPELDRYMQSHESANVVGYAGTAGTLFHILILVAAALFVLAMVFVAMRAVLVLGAPRAIDGLRTGALVGLSAFAFVLAAKLLTASWYRGAFEDGTTSTRWGLDAGPLFQTGAELIGLTAVSGLVYAALRPRPLRYQPWRPRFAALPAVLWPDEAARARGPVSGAVAEPIGTPSDASKPDVRFCSNCGREFTREDDSFCPSCGAPRA